MQRKVQSVANNVTGWFSSNMMVSSGDKTKLLVLGTSANRANRLIRSGKIVQVSVKENLKQESESKNYLELL